MMKRIFYIIILLFSFTQVWAQKAVEFPALNAREGATLYFRGEPSYSADITDTLTSVRNDDLGYYLDWCFCLLEEVNAEWVKAGLFLKERYLTNQHYYATRDIRHYVRYIDKASLRKGAAFRYWINRDVRINIYGEPDSTGAVQTVIKGLSGPADPRTLYVHYADKDAPWRRVNMSEWQMDKIEKMQVYAEAKVLDTCTTLIGREFNDGKSHDSESFSSMTRDSVHIWLLWLLIANFVLSIFSVRAPMIWLTINLLTLLPIFALEAYYIVLLDEKFWWTNFDTMGWIKAGLYLLLSMVALYWQYRQFNAVIRMVKETYNSFNTSIGTLWFVIAVIVLGILSYINGWDLEWGEFSKPLIVLVILQAIQMIVIFVGLRRYPLMAILIAIFVPLGALATLLTFIRLLADMILFTIVGGVIYAWSQSGGNYKGSGTRRRGDAQHCPHCNYPWCTFIAGDTHECTLIKGDQCEHGQF
jgi:hypothetical protein